MLLTVSLVLVMAGVPVADAGRQVIIMDNGEWCRPGAVLTGSTTRCAAR